MTPSNRTYAQIAIALGSGALIGCCLGAIIITALVAQPVIVGALVKTATPTIASVTIALPTITLASPATRTPIVTAPPASTPESIVTATPVAPATVRPPATRAAPRPITQHFVLGRPVMMPADKITPALYYLYGTTGMGSYDVHHGEEFVNPVGTPLYAVADGTIVVAGTDTQPLCGDDRKLVCGRDLSPDTGGFYGKVVVLQLTRDYNGQRIFALHGHMSKINVTVGDQVKTGDLIGEIGGSGVAQGGAHVHFEVRLGVNDYAHTRNPILWMTPLAGRGAIAGRYTDSKGAVVRSAVINLYRDAPDGFLYSTETYGRDRWAVNSDDEIGENFSMPDLAPGDYIIRVSGQPYTARVTVESGKLSFVELGGP